MTQAEPSTSETSPVTPRRFSWLLLLQYQLRSLLMLAALGALPLVADAGVFARHRCRASYQSGECRSIAPANAAATNPHAPNAIHPPEVLRILKLLPQIPADASYDKIIKMLGLPNDWTGGSVSSTHCDMTWDIARAYRFALSFDPVPKSGKLNLEFTSAGISAQNKPGFSPQEYHTIYPYRTWQGMVHK